MTKIRFFAIVPGPNSKHGFWLFHRVEESSEVRVLGYTLFRHIVGGALGSARCFIGTRKFMVDVALGCAGCTALALHLRCDFALTCATPILSRWSW